MVSALLEPPTPVAEILKPVAMPALVRFCAAFLIKIRAAASLTPVLTLAPQFSWRAFTPDVRAGKLLLEITTRSLVGVPEVVMRNCLPGLRDTEAKPLSSKPVLTEAAPLKIARPVWVVVLEKVVAPVTVSVLPKVVTPEILAAPPTSRAVSVTLPALIPNLELVVNSKLVETDTPAPNRVKPSKAVEPLTSRPPEMRRSEAAAIVPVWVVTAVP